MNKYFCKVSFGICCCESTCIIVANTENDALGIAREEAIENAQSYGFEQDLDYFGDADTVGKDYDEDEETYTQEGYLDYFVELYDPEKHDDLI